jgi:hypothetical protein
MTMLDFTVILWGRINSKECFIVIIFVGIWLPFVIIIKREIKYQNKIMQNF